MTTTQYLANPAISNSKLNWLKKSPLHFKYYSEKGVSRTKSQEFGEIIQLALLNPVEFTNQYFMLPSEDKRTIIGKIATKMKMTENQGKIGLPKELFDAVVGIQQSVFSHKQIKKLLSTQSLAPVFWTDEDTMVECKARPEIYSKGKWMADVITTSCADPDTFLYDILRYGYHRKAAFQLDGVKESIPFYVIAVEKQAPYAATVIKLPKVLIEKGRKEYKELLKKYAHCQLMESWPGYENKSLEEKTIKNRLKYLLSA